MILWKCEWSIVPISVFLMLIFCFVYNSCFCKSSIKNKEWVQIDCNHPFHDERGETGAGMLQAVHVQLVRLFIFMGDDFNSLSFKNPAKLNLQILIKYDNLGKAFLYFKKLCKTKFQFEKINFNQFLSWSRWSYF